MNHDAQTDAILSAGMKLLCDNLGAIETEIFIATIGRGDFDYTKWRENLWEDLAPEELFDRAAQTAENHIPSEKVAIIKA